jgi:transcription-repair coupling factor (superfamily II helicase)
VAFKKLGLLIIDEEHRFGVAAKESLRRMRADVDTLALTATPIPRTLHFSLLGARDLSIIATPPRNRMAIITEITQWNSDLIREAVLRELHRGGQVYFVHDRIQTMGEVAERLRTILPGIRIAAGHGQMHAHELEKVMMDFLEKRVDVLLSTKIIESGLDIPNVNTILINRADRFGMAELYQLRGRVGRSNVQAYAYLLTPPVAVLPPATIRRLQALQEFNELGSGFNLAMRDLEIRGAGNLLGAEQSGFIESLGFETYTRILEEAVRELKEEEFQDLLKKGEQRRGTRRDTVVEPRFDALIPEDYVGAEMERLSIYRRLYMLTTQAQLDECAAELRDRFGRFPLPVEQLFGVVRLRLSASRSGFPKVGISETEMEIEFPPESDTEFYEAGRFQGMMYTIGGLKGKGVALRQHGSTLKLHILLPTYAPGLPPVEAGLSILRLL